MKIMSLLLKRTQYALSSVKDIWLDEAVKSDEEEFAIILTSNSLNHIRVNRDAIIALREKYFLKAMFDMKNPYSNTNINVFLYIFSKKKTNMIIYGIYRTPLKTHHTQNERFTFTIDEKLPSSYLTYIENVERYINSGCCPDDNSFQEFGEFESDIRSEKCWNPNRYSKTVVKVRNALKNEKTIPLGEIAKIYRPNPNAERKRTEYCATFGSWTYPVDYSGMREGVFTDCPLHKGDIVLFDSQRMFLVYEEPIKELHTSPNYYIIRPDNISPEYLYTYLSSETAQIVMDAESNGGIIRRIGRKDLLDLPIILPEKDEQYYKQLFYANNFPIKNIEEINSAIFNTNISETEKSVEDILDLELINKLRVYKEEIKERILDEDLKEINICFNHKAYKATLILAGSILEAVLIDWLSELHGKNYFEEEYIDHRGKQGTLAIYIRDIKYLKRPGWIDEAEKAYTIKEKRNQVHAKLCLKSEEITEDLCREVISYLTDV